MRKGVGIVNLVVEDYWGVEGGERGRRRKGSLEIVRVVIAFCGEKLRLWDSDGV